MQFVFNVLLVLTIADAVTCSIFNTTITEIDNNIKDFRRKKPKKERSTSSSSGEKRSGSSDRDDGDSLQLTDTDTSSSSDKKYTPKPSTERKGWRKWHRNCHTCPEDMVKKWRDPSIRWICGAYQRARRSFKSLCMMHYRNCQDGTMFIKIHDHRCQNDTSWERPHGDHFFYDYKVVLSADSSYDSSKSSELTSSSNDK